MAVRPFYIKADIEGRKTLLSGGPKNKDGDVTIHILQRSEGDITEPFKVRQYSTYETDKETGKEIHYLHTSVYYNGVLLKDHVTDY